MTKFVFLDIDGVLTTDLEFYVTTLDFWKENEWAKNLKVMYPFNKKCVELFNRILTEFPDIEIILSSDWRKHNTLIDLDIIFKCNGVIKSPKYTTDKTSSYFGDWLEKSRMNDIEKYLRDNDMIDKDWIILDDLDIRQWLPIEYQDRFIQTNDVEGLTEDGIVERIIDKLKSYETEESSI